NREDLAARFDDDALACRRKRHACQTVRDVFPIRHHPRKVTGRDDAYDLRFSTLWIEFVYVSGLLENHSACARVDRLHVEISKLCDLRELFSLRLILPN